MKIFRLIFSMIGLELSTISTSFFVFLFIPLFKSSHTFWLGVFVIGMIGASVIAAVGFFVDILSLYFEENDVRRI